MYITRELCIHMLANNLKNSCRLSLLIDSLHLRLFTSVAYANKHCNSCVSIGKTAAIAARSVERAKILADKFNVKTAYGSYDDIAGNPDIDIVYVGVIHVAHFHLTKMMLCSKKSVICEAPVGFSLKQVQEVIQLAKENNQYFMEGIFCRCFPVYKNIKEEIQHGILGEIKLITASIHYDIGELEWVKDLDLGGGCLMTAGVYAIQLANWIFNNEKPERIFAVRDTSSMDADTSGTVILMYKNGAKAVLTFGFQVDGTPNLAEIYGGKGRIEVPEFACPSEATLPSGKTTNALPEGPVPYNYLNTSGLRFEADYARQCIQAGQLECPMMLFTDSLLVHEILDEARRQIGVEYII